MCCSACRCCWNGLLCRGLCVSTAANDCISCFSYAEYSCTANLKYLKPGHAAVSVCRPEIVLSSSSVRTDPDDSHIQLFPNLLFHQILLCYVVVAMLNACVTESEEGRGHSIEFYLGGGGSPEGLTPYSYLQYTNFARNVSRFVYTFVICT